MAHWHYQLMYHKYDKPILGEDGYYAVHEYYEMDDGDGYPQAEIDKMGDHFYCRYWEQEIKDE